MTGALIQPHEPEKAAVRAAGFAVADYIDAVGSDRQDHARHAAAQSMYEAWTTVVSRQPRRLTPSDTVRGLQETSRELHMLFADAMTAANSHVTPDPSAAETARSVARQIADRDPSATTTPYVI